MRMSPPSCHPSGWMLVRDTPRPGWRRACRFAVCRCWPCRDANPSGRVGGRGSRPPSIGSVDQTSVCTSVHVSRHQTAFPDGAPILCMGGGWRPTPAAQWVCPQTIRCGKGQFAPENELTHGRFLSWSVMFSSSKLRSVVLSMPRRQWALPVDHTSKRTNADQLTSQTKSRPNPDVWCTHRCDPPGKVKRVIPTPCPLSYQEVVHVHRHDVTREDPRQICEQVVFLLG